MKLRNQKTKSETTVRGETLDGWDSGILDISGAVRRLVRREYPREFFADGLAQIENRIVLGDLVEFELEICRAESGMVKHIGESIVFEVVK